MNYSTLSPIVVDANLAAKAIIPVAREEFAVDLFLRWGEEERALYAPNWWLAEITTVIRQYVYHNLLDPSAEGQAIDRIFLLDVELVPIDRGLCLSALNWAARIGQSKAYDSFYLALAEQLNAEFWTADKKLVTAARAAGAGWAHFSGES
ncbi:MAG: type II toxin-antitoxin system VapC family toxin [bacterium]